MSEKIEREVREFMGALGMLTSVLSITVSILFMTSSPIAFVSTVISFLIVDVLIWLNWNYRIVPGLISYELVTCARIVIAIVFYIASLLLFFAMLIEDPIYVTSLIALGLVNLVLGIVLIASYRSRIAELKRRFWTIK